MVITIAVMISDETVPTAMPHNVASKVGGRDRTVGVLHVRPSDAVPFRWTSRKLPLLTRASGKCKCNGHLTLSVLWRMSSLVDGLKQYVKPPLPVRYYTHPWTPKQRSLPGRVWRGVGLHIDCCAANG